VAAARIYRHFATSRELQGSAVLSAVLGVMFLCVGGVAALVFSFDALVEHLAIRDSLHGWDWLFLLGLLVGPVMLGVSFSRSRRARSLARIEKRGIPAWARVTRIRQAAESKAHRMLYTLRLQVQTDDGGTFEAAALDYLPIPDAALHTWTEVYELWLPVLLDPSDRSSAKILWNDPRIRWSS